MSLNFIDIVIITVINIVLTITIGGWMVQQSANQLIGYHYEDQLKNEKRFVYIKEVLGLKDITGVF